MRGAVRAKWLSRQLGVTPQAAHKWIQKFVRMGELVMQVDGPRGRYYPVSTPTRSEPGGFWELLTTQNPSVIYLQASRAGSRLVRRSQARELYDPLDPRLSRVKQLFALLPKPDDFDDPEVPHASEEPPSLPRLSRPEFAIVDFARVIQVSEAFVHELFTRSLLRAQPINATGEVTQVIRAALGHR